MVTPNILTQKQSKLTKYLLPLALTLFLHASQGIPQIFRPQTGFKFQDMGAIPPIQILLQDDKGFLWLGHDGGLSRFDGYETKTYTYSPHDTNSLSSSIVYYLFQENEEFLWIGTSKGGTNRLNLKTGKVTKFIHNPENDSTLNSNTLWRIFRGNSGTLWFLTEAGLNKFVSQETADGKTAREYFEQDTIAKLDWSGWLARDWAWLSEDELFAHGDIYFFDPRLEVLYRMENPLQFDIEGEHTEIVVKTSDCMLDENGNLRIMDFGLSRSPLVTTMTTLGSVIGTLGYVAPEQVTGTNVDHRVDIFSYGVVMYELLTNELPFKGEEMALIHSIFNTVPPAPSTLRKGDLPGEWDAAVSRCLEKNPADRISCMEEVIKLIEVLPS